MTWIVGIDTGGTFTDVFAANVETAEIRCVKLSSTPDDPSRAILDGLRELSRQGVDLGHLSALAHGTTVGTNALIQRQGGRVAVVTTRGFRDLLEIGRQIRPKIYDLQMDVPAPLAERAQRFEVTERVLADGSVRTELDASSLRELAEKIAASAADACAICFLFSFLNPEHERIVRERLQSLLPDVRFSISSEVQPEFREFERFNTTVMNSYLQPVMEGYLDKLAHGLARLAPRATLGVNQSSGGLMDSDLARSFPVRTALSGPAAGVVGAVEAARQASRSNLITVDVGGTSADVALIRDFRPNVAREREVAGFPIRLPMIDIDTIGAGGGSVAWFDRDGLLKVGPKSAGAVPGPACYGQGGTEATVSDANLVLGRLAPELVNGGLKLDLDLARGAISPHSGRLCCSVERAALSIIEIVVSNMVRALRTISVEKGHDPSDFTLMPFGGAGPLHARDIATDLGIREILVPAAPGIVCAQGLLVADQREDFVLSRRTTVCEAGMAQIAEDVRALEEKVTDWSGRAAGAACRRELVLDARYVGQNFELQVPAGAARLGEPLPIPGCEEFLAGFFSAHEQAYGFANRRAPVEIVNTRVTGLIDGFRLPEPETALKPSVPPTRSRRAVWFDGDGAVETSIYRREDLSAGCVLSGPAIIEQLDTTIPIYPGDTATVDRFGNILIEIKT